MDLVSAPTIFFQVGGNGYPDAIIQFMLREANPNDYTTTTPPPLNAQQKLALELARQSMVLENPAKYYFCAFIADIHEGHDINYVHQN